MVSTQNFNAEQWLKENSQLSLGATELPSDSRSHFPKDCFIPGWNGDSLLSKSALKIQKLIHKLQTQALTNLLSQKRMNRSMKQYLYDEFISFSNSAGFMPDEFDTMDTLIAHIHNPNSPHREILDQFIGNYCYRLAIIYIFKVRFIATLSSSLDISIRGDHFINTINFINKHFPNASSVELQSFAFKANKYGWFIPPFHMKDEICELVPVLMSLSLTEILKLVSKTLFFSDSNPLEDDKEYSHALSHQEWGLFVNTLLINFVDWVKRKPFVGKPKTNHVINCKFAGDNLRALIHSHWLAQTKNMQHSWRRILCPDFFSPNYSNGDFTKICQELQFLTFLVELAKHQQKSPIPFMAQLMKEKNLSRSSSGQIGFLNTNSVDNQTVYDRVVLNISRYPQKNGHGFVLGKLNQEIERLAPEGTVLLATNQKLFIPSRTNRMQQLLNKVKLEGIFDLTLLKGRGEIPAYLYIFSKRNPSTHTLKEYILDRKDSFYNFHLAGDLSHFNLFSHFEKEFDRIFKKDIKKMTSFFHQELGNNLSLSFNHDAIINGKIIHSQTEDRFQVTHPNFFKSLTSSSLPLDYFFKIDEIKKIEDLYHKDTSTNLFSEGILSNRKFPYVLVINTNNGKTIDLNIIHSNSFRALYEDLGTAYYKYFGLIPKHKDLNLDLFRLYFQSQLGEQIIQMSLQGSTKHLKGKLESLLLPRLLNKTSESFRKLGEFEKVSTIPHSVDGFLTYPELLEEFIEQNHSAATGYDLLCCLNQIKINLETHKKQESTLSNGPYSHPFIQKDLTKLHFHPLKNHPDVFVEVVAKNLDALSRISVSDINFESKNAESGHVFLINYQEIPLLKFYSSESLIEFIALLLEKSSKSQVSIYNLLIGLNLPSSDDIETLRKKELALNEVLEKIENQLKNSINRIISKSLI